MGGSRPGPTGPRPKNGTDDGQDLENHKKVHTSCDTCKKDFKTKSKLERHLKTHM